MPTGPGQRTLVSPKETSGFRLRNRWFLLKKPMASAQETDGFRTGTHLCGTSHLLCTDFGFKKDGCRTVASHEAARLSKTIRIRLRTIRHLSLYHYIYHFATYSYSIG